MYTTTNNFEKIVIERCIDCHSVTPTMFRIRTGFNIVGVVCSNCFKERYKKQYSTPFVTFTKPNDLETGSGIKALNSKSGFMRLHQNSNFLSKKNSIEIKQKKKISKTNSALNESLKDNLEAYYYLIDQKELSINGMYQVLEYTNKRGEKLKVYYTIYNEKPIARFLMNSSGKIIQYFKEEVKTSNK